MRKNAVKYIQLCHQDYWWEVYQCAGGNAAGPNRAACSLSDDKAGEAPFFRFDLYNLPGLRAVLREGGFAAEGHPDRAAFLRRAEILERGGADCFIGALYYREYTPDLDFCNQPLTPERRLPDLKAPPTAPCCAVLFLAEERPLSPEVLTNWLGRLSRRLFGQDFFCEIACVPTREAAQASWQARQAP